MCIVKYIDSTYYSRQVDNTYQRQITLDIDGEVYVFTIVVPSDDWNLSISKATTYWISRAKKGDFRNISWGTIKREKKQTKIEETTDDFHLEERGKEMKQDNEREKVDDLEKEKEKDTLNIREEGPVDETSSSVSSVEKGFRCSICSKLYSFKSSLSRHKKMCLLKKEAELDGERIKENDIFPQQFQTQFQSQTTSSTPFPDVSTHHSAPALVNNNGQNVTVMNIQNNVNIRSLGKENPRWLTSNLLFQVLSDIPSAIPRLMEFKHFNDEFPENKNIRIDTRRTIDKRLQVFDTGRWRVKDSKQTFYKVLIDIYDILSDALENDLSEPEHTDDDISDEERLHIYNELTKLKSNARFIQKLEKIRPIWEDFREKIDDHEQRNDLWEDLKTLLLDRRLAIEQGFD